MVYQSCEISYEYTTFFIEMHFSHYPLNYCHIFLNILFIFKMHWVLQLKCKNAFDFSRFVDSVKHPPKEHTIPTDVLPSDSEDLFRVYLKITAQPLFLDTFDY